METSGVYFGSLKTFLPSVKLEIIRIGTSLNILVTQNAKTAAELRQGNQLGNGRVIAKGRWGSLATRSSSSRRWKTLNQNPGGSTR